MCMLMCICVLSVCIGIYTAVVTNIYYFSNG